MRFPQLAASVLALALSVPALAQTGVPSATSNWEVNWGEHRCTLGARTADDRPIRLAVGLSLGSFASGEIVFQNPAWNRDPVNGAVGTPVEIVLQPGDVRLSGQAVGGRAPGGRVIVIRGLGEDLLEKFADSGVLTVQRNGRTIVGMSYAEADKAIEALNRCNDDLMRSWGYDPRAFDDFQRKPEPFRGSEASWFNPEDYPDEAMRTSAEGTVVVRVAVGTDDQPETCAVLVSSRVPSLDSVTCAVIMRRGRWEPAIDANGQPAAVPQLLTVRWVLG